VNSGGTPQPHLAANDDNAPSELLGPLLEQWRDVLVRHVLERLDPKDCAMLAQVAKPWLAVVVVNNLPRAGKGEAMPLKLVDFCGSVEKLAWAKENGCPWGIRTCRGVAAGGHLEVLQWAREHGCPWDPGTCGSAARYGHLEVLVWAREHGCPWDRRTCSSATAGGHLAVLQWAREHDCPWGEDVCARAAQNGDLEVLRWAREHGCPWDLITAFVTPPLRVVTWRC
jgi:hypothetical protein